MKKIVCHIQDFRTVCEHLESVLRPGTENSDLHFYSKSGEIIEVHIPNLEIAIKKGYTPQFFYTSDPVNYLNDSKTS